MGAAPVAYGQRPRFPSHRVAGGGRPLSPQAHIITAGRKVPRAAIVATVNEGHSRSEHAQPLGSVHPNRTSGTTR
jgi:hypothetical protein